MNINPFNEFKFIHDNRPDIRYAICGADEGTSGLSIRWLVDGTDEYSEEDFQRYMKFNFNLFKDYDVDEICIKIIKYSDLIQSKKGIRGLYRYSDIWTCDSFIVDFHR